MKDLQGWQYDAKAMEFEHAKLLVEQNKQRRDPRPGRPDQKSGQLSLDGTDTWVDDEVRKVLVSTTKG